jgi:hypothetical protein
MFLQEAVLRLTVGASTRWHELTRPQENDRGDSPVPTVIIWAGIAAVAIALLIWVGTFVTSFEGAAPKTTDLP